MHASARVRIAHLLTGGDVAGGQVIALRLCRAARTAGHEPLIISPTAGELVDEARSDGFSIEFVDVTRTIRVGGAIRLTRVLRRLGVELLHTHTHVAANILGRLAARAADAAVLSHLHIENHFRDRPLGRTALVRLDNATASLCARMIAVSRATRDAFVAQGFPAAVVEVVHNGVDVDSLEAAPPTELRRELGLRASTVVVGEIGRLAPVKGQHELVSALAGLRARGHDVHAVFLGRDTETGGAYEQHLRALAAALGVADSVSFTGFRPDAASVLRELDVLALPSWIEGLPLVVLEAMAHAKPVVASSVGGTPEAVIDGETGLLVPARDVRALEAALETLVVDSGRRRRLGELGKERVRRHFGAAAMEQRVLEVYDEIAAAR
jgi:glycosyltransferase involved in cell wall biosynthesis